MDIGFASASLSATAIARDRVLRGAARPIAPLNAVMSSPPTVTQGTTSANSTIITGANVSGTGARYPILSTDTSSKVFEAVGGLLQNNRIRNTYQGGAYSVQHVAGIRFATYASLFDISLGSSGATVMVYVTDALTGVRARIAADDITLSTQPQYFKVDFGSRALRIIEVYFAGFIYGINVPTTDSIWIDPAVDQPRIAAVMDSYGVPTFSLATGESAPTNPLRLGYPDYLFGFLGCNNPHISAYSGTGVIANNGTPGLSFTDRVNGGGIGTGDMDVAKIGPVDLIYTYNSVNDGGETDGALATATTAFVQRLMVAQPNALIVVAGFQSTKTFTPAQTRYDSQKAAVLAAAAGDPRVVFLDNGPSSENWMFGDAANGINTVIVGSDNTHLGKAGQVYLGERAARCIVANIRNLSL
jgi:hypothetical protein